MIVKYYTDRQIVEGITSNDHQIIEYFLFEKCGPIISYILYSMYGGRANRDELINELFLYLASGEWAKLKQFDYRSKLTTWLGVVAIRFFQKKRECLIENDSFFTLHPKEETKMITTHQIENTMDIRAAINKMPNERYRLVIEELDLKETEPEKLAAKMNITVDNLYNLHRRSLAQLRVIMGRKEDYYE